MTSNLPNNHQECLKEFIEIYRNENCLWQMTSKDYHNKAKKEKSYLKLVQKLKEIEPLATKETVLKKINNIRSNFRKELKKVQLSCNSAAEVDDIYVPKLWYFKLLNFLTDEEMPRTSCSNLDSGDGDEQQSEFLEISHYKCEPIHDTSYLECTITAPNTSNASGAQKRKRVQDETLTHDVLSSINNHFKRSQIRDDRFDVFGNNVAMKLRDLPKYQRIICEKLINDALYAAEMGSLTATHTLMQSNITQSPS